MEWCMGNVVYPSGTSVVPLCTTARACAMEWCMGNVVYPSGTSVVPLCTTAIACLWHRKVPKE